jgi:hypothetical protein
MVVWCGVHVWPVEPLAGGGGGGVYVVVCMHMCMWWWWACVPSGMRACVCVRVCGCECVGVSIHGRRADRSPLVFMSLWWCGVCQSSLSSRMGGCRHARL